MKKYLIANWKSNKNIEAVKKWFADFAANLEAASEQSQVIVAPAYPLLPAALEELKNTEIKVDLAVQDISIFPAGAYTGAVCAANLENLNVTYSLMGHSERRKYFHETCQDVAKKVEQALENKIKPILCIDEPYLMEQANVLDKELYSQCIIAYEPIDAISTMADAKNANLAKVKEVISLIKNVYGDIPVTYGGSVDENNINEYLMVSDGVLVGGASLDGQQFARVVNQANVDD